MKVNARCFLSPQESSTAGVEHEIAERQEGHESHVVSHYHGTEIGYEYKRRYHGAQGLETTDDTVGEPYEKFDVLESGDHRERAEKAGKRTPVEIIGVLRVEGHEYRSDERRRYGDEQYGVRLQKFRYVIFFDELAYLVGVGHVMTVMSDCGAASGVAACFRPAGRVGYRAFGTFFPLSFVRVYRLIVP